MKEYNFNRKGQAVLTEGFAKRNKGRNLLLLISMALGITLVFTIFQLVLGKIDRDYRKNLQEDGCTATAYLDNGEREQQEKLNALIYVNRTGNVKVTGELSYGDQKKVTCLVTDMKTFKEMYRPAFGEVEGSYPEGENEVMLSKKTLHAFGIDDASPGMKLTLPYSWKLFGAKKHEGNDEFILSGIYESASIDEQPAFLSAKWIESAGIEFYPNRILIEQKNNTTSGKRLEGLLEGAIQKDAEKQKFYVRDTAMYRAELKTTGGRPIAYGFSALLLLSIFLLTYNILLISQGKSIRDYGLLLVIGVSPRSLNRLTFKENMRTAIGGSILGCLLGLVSAGTVSHFITGSNKVHILLLFGITGCCFILFLIASRLVMRRLRQLTPISALNFTEAYMAAHPHRKRRRPRKNRVGGIEYKNAVWGLAHGFIRESGKGHILTVCAVFLGCLMALASSVLSYGFNEKYAMSKEADFSLELSPEFSEALSFASLPLNYHFVDTDTVSALKKISHSDKIKVDSGYYLITDSEDGKDEWGYTPMDRVLFHYNYLRNLMIPLSRDDIDKLSHYADKENAGIDFRLLRKANGIVIGHHNALPKEKHDEAKAMIGSTFFSRENEDSMFIDPADTAGEERELVNLGYLDVTDKFFPDIYLPWKSIPWENNGFTYYLCNEELFDKLGDNWQKQPIRLSFSVGKSGEPKIKRKLYAFVKKENQKIKADLKNEYEVYDQMLTLTAKSDSVADKMPGVKMNEAVMKLVSSALLLLGTFGLINVFIAGVLGRIKERDMLHQIGMTRHQIKRMLLVESLYYVVEAGILLLTLGSLLLTVFGRLLKTMVPGFVFRFPFATMGFMLLILLLLGTTLPLLGLHKLQKQRNG